MTIEELFGTLQMSVVSGWRKHLRTAKYAKHEALDEFYKGMPEKVDALIEAWMGAHGKKVGSFQNILSSSNMNTLKYLGELKRVCKEGYVLMGDNDELKSLLDDIVNLINSTLYKVKELAESNSFKSLVEYVNESLVNENYEPTSKPRDWEKVLKKLNSAAGYSNYSQLCDIENIIKYNGDAAEWLESIESEHKIKLDEGDRIALQDIVSFYQENYEYHLMHYRDQEEEIEEFKENTPLNDNKAVNYGVECEDYYESYTYIGDNSGKKYAQLIAKYGDCSEDYSGY
jgi:DNA-binding ferritin-like protein